MAARTPLGCPDRAIELVTVPCDQLDDLIRALTSAREQLARHWPDELIR